MVTALGRRRGRGWCPSRCRGQHAVSNVQYLGGLIALVQSLAAAIRRTGLEPSMHATGGGSDASVFNERGIVTVNLGVGYEAIHSTDEHIAVAELRRLAQVLVALIVIRSVPVALRTAAVHQPGNASPCREATMDTVITQFLNQVEGRNGRPFSRNTLAAYRRDLTQFRSFVVEQGATSWEIEPATLLEFRQWLRERDLALASQARKLAAVKSFFGYLAREGIIPSNPAAALTGPQVDHAPPADGGRHRPPGAPRRSRRRCRPRGLPRSGHAGPALHRRPPRLRDGRAGRYAP